MKLRLGLLAFSLAILSSTPLFAAYDPNTGLETLPDGLPSSVAITATVSGKVLNFTATWDEAQCGWDSFQSGNSVLLSNFNFNYTDYVNYTDILFPDGQWLLDLGTSKGDAYYMLTDPNGGLEFTTGIYQPDYGSLHATGLVTVGDRGFTDPKDGSTFAVTAVPEPASLLCLTPVAALGLLRRRHGASVAR